VSDGSNAYKASIQTCLPQARHVLDRFGVIRWFTAGLTAVRRDIQRRNDGTKPVAGPQVFRARFLLTRRGDTLTDTDHARLDQLFDAHPRLKTCWQALQELHGLYLADDHNGALEALDRFGDLYKTGELPEFENIVDTIINWSDEIPA
ncbi:MAG: transposase, partial [Acidimicrobiia bacterium]|nr:transposase [Acidimicrobiia bacterium]